MNNSDVVKFLSDMMQSNEDFYLHFISGNGECKDEIKIKSLNQPFNANYNFSINVYLHASSWAVNVNGFNVMKNIDTMQSLEFAVLHLMQFSKSACAEQELYELQPASDLDSFY